MSESMKIFKATCDELGVHLSALGFKYLKSKRSASRQGVLFEHRVSFGTSRSTNSIPGSVGLEVRASAVSEGFGEFRRQQGDDLPINEAWLFSTPIENIFENAPPYIRYDIGADSERGEILTNIKAVISSNVMQIFDLIESPEELRAHLQTNPIPCLERLDTLARYYEFTQIA